jgi:hypothetical protein
MNRALAALRFRWILPLAQLLICLVALWPVRWFLFFEVSYSARALLSQGGSIQFTQADINAIEKAWVIRERLMKVPILLDFPVLVLELPYTLTVYARSGRPAAGLQLETWRALGWPFAGMLFWWSVGRAIEALRAARRSLVLPRITLGETVAATVLVCIGIVSLVGILTSTRDDRAGFDFLMFVGGGLLWGLLAATTVAATVVQRRILSRTAGTA